MPKDKATFTVAYSGIDSSRMDIRQLAPALLALGDLLVAANKVLNGNRATITVNVLPFRNGSFGIFIEVVQSLLDSIKGLLDASPVKDALGILEALGFSFKEVSLGIFGLIGL